MVIEVCLGVALRRISRVRVENAKRNAIGIFLAYYFEARITVMVLIGLRAMNSKMKNDS
jgi:hypothetical protein